MYLSTKVSSLASSSERPTKTSSVPTCLRQNTPKYELRWIFESRFLCGGEYRWQFNLEIRNVELVVGGQVVGPCGGQHQLVPGLLACLLSWCGDQPEFRHGCCLRFVHLAFEVTEGLNKGERGGVIIVTSGWDVMKYKLLFPVHYFNS